MDIEVFGLTCDKPGCDYQDDTPSSEYKSCINKPCPKCGSSLLTQADYDAVLKMQKIADSKIIKFFERIAIFFGSKEVTKKAIMDGSGKVTFVPDDRK